MQDLFDLGRSKDSLGHNNTNIRQLKLACLSDSDDARAIFFWSGTTLFLLYSVYLVRASSTWRDTTLCQSALQMEK